MWRSTTVRGTAISLVIFGVAAYYLPGHGPSDEIELVLTITTFLFAIITGFFLTHTYNRYNQIRVFAGTEDSLLLSLHRSSMLLGSGVAKKYTNLIEAYYLESYDWMLGEAYKHTAPIFLSFYEPLIKGANLNSAVLQHVLGLLGQIETQRTELSSYASERIKFGHWCVQLLLAGIIIFCIFYLRVPDFFLQAVSVILCSTIVLIVLIILDLDSLRISGSLLLEESGQEVLEYIGRKRYYNHLYLAASGMPSTVKEYRLGLHKPGEKPNIILVKR